MKVLFLDIDGVVNSRDTTNFKKLWPLDQYMAFMVGQIVLGTGCEVVVSSSWRNHPKAIEVIQEAIVNVIGVTPNHSIREDENGRNVTRGSEVKAWLDVHPEVTKYAILDDDSDFYDDQPLFKTTFQSGLTEEIRDKVIEYLNEEKEDLKK